jgi:hypothetical protein
MKMQKLILIDDDLFDYLKRESDKDTRTVNSFIVKILKEHQKKNDRKK